MDAVSTSQQFRELEGYTNVALHWEALLISGSHERTRPSSSDLARGGRRTLLPPDGDRGFEIGGLHADCQATECDCVACI